MDAAGASEIKQARRVALSVQGLSKRYRMQARTPAKVLARLVAESDEGVFWALRNVSFSVMAGERVGVIGRNGAGKSTLLKILSRVVAPTEGRAEIRGRVASLLEVGTGFNPNLTGRENVFLNAALFGLSRADVEARLGDIIAFAEIGRFIDEPVKVYSTGMRSRLGFAVAAHLDPKVLMLDEVLSVGDAAFQAKCLARVGELVEGERTLLFVSHSIAAVRRFCQRCIWLERGEVVMDGDVSAVTEAYEAKMLNVRAEYRAPERPVAAKPDAVGEFAPAASVVSARVIDAGGHPLASVKIDAPFEVEVVFDVTEAGRRVEPALHFFNERDELIFVVAFTAPDWPGAVDRSGRYRAVASMPGNVLNDGVHRISVVLATADPIYRHEVLEKVISFAVYETAATDPLGTARGRYARQFPGAIRPRLDWRCAPIAPGE